MTVEQREADHQNLIHVTLVTNTKPSNSRQSGLLLGVTALPSIHNIGHCSYIYQAGPSSVVRDKGSGLRNLGNFCLWNPKSWALESGIQLKESGMPLIDDWNPEPMFH